MNGVNGDYDGTLKRSACASVYAHSGCNWWKVDLEFVYDIKLVTILNRRDCCGKLNKYNYTNKIGTHNEY